MGKTRTELYSDALSDYENRKNCSLNRLSKLKIDESEINRFRQETIEFSKKHGLRVSNDYSAMPKSLVEHDEFKYCQEFSNIHQRIQEGENVELYYINNEEFGIVAFAIVRHESEFSLVEIFNVHPNFRRSGIHNICQTIQIRNENFTIGMGHVLAHEITARIDRPIGLNVTTSSIKYVFMSLGYIEYSDNNASYLWIRNKPPIELFDEN